MDRLLDFQWNCKIVNISDGTKLGLITSNYGKDPVNNVMVYDHLALLFKIKNIKNMSKKDEYGLEFKKIVINGKAGYSCIRKAGIVDKNNLLQFLTDLDMNTTEFLLNEVNNYLNNPINPNWTEYQSMALEHIDLVIDYPDFIVDEQYKFPLVDIKSLLEEWLIFLQT